MTFSEKLQRLRKAKQLSQEELADELEVSRQAVSKWEVGEIPNLENLMKLSKFFGCTLDYLVNEAVEGPAGGGVGTEAAGQGEAAGNATPGNAAGTQGPGRKKRLHLPSLLLGAAIPLAILAAVALLRTAAPPKQIDMNSQAGWNGYWLLFMDWGDDYQAGYMKVDNGTMHAYLNGDRTKGNINTDYTYENGLFDSSVTGEPFAPILVSPERIILDVPNSWRWKLVRPSYENYNLYAYETSTPNFMFLEVPIPPELEEFDLTVCCELGATHVWIVDENGEIIRKNQTLNADSGTPSFTEHFRREGYSGSYRVKLKGEYGFPAAGWYAWE